MPLGTLDNQSPDPSFSQAAIENHGIINNIGNLINNGGSITNRAVGTINNSGLFNNDPPAAAPFTRISFFISIGTVNNSGTIHNFGTFKNSRTFPESPDGGTINNSPSGIINNLEHSLIENRGKIENNGRINNEELIDIVGGFPGTTINNNQGGIIKNFKNIQNGGGGINNNCGGLIENTGTIFPNPINELLCIPVLNDPSDGATVNTATPAFSWSNNPLESRTITQYEWKINPASDPSGIPIEIVSLSLQSHTPLAPLSNGDYVWTVRATGANALPYPHVIVPSAFASSFSLTVDMDTDGDGIPDSTDSNPLAFTAVNTGNWNDPNVWEGGIVPGDADDKEILSGVTVTITSSINNSGAIIGNYGILENSATITNLDGGINNYGTLNNSGTISNDITTINNYGTINNSGTITNANSDIINNASGIINNSGAISNNGNLINNEGGVINNTSSETITNDFRIFNLGEINNSGAIDNTSSGSIANDGVINNQCNGEINNLGSITRNSVTEILCIPNLVSPVDGSTVADSKSDITWDANGETRPVMYSANLEDTSNPGVPIELVSLSLVSAEPLNDLTDGSYEWFVTSTLDPSYSPGYPYTSTLDPSYSPGYPYTSTPVESTTFSFDVLLPVVGDLFCDDMTIDELIASGNYNVIDNRDRHLGKNVKGTNGNDLILLSDLGDKANARNGDDCVIGGAGNDNIHGGKGNDQIFGQGGNDKISGNQGNDHISGGDGNDKLWGGLGNDTIDAGDGDDRAHGNQGTDTVNGGAGNDWLGAGIGNDTVNGGEGNDKIFGRPGADTLNGDEGDDKIHGGQGNDNINGGEGNDQCHGGQGANTFANCESTKGQMAEEDDESEPEDE
jgi:Ca2+-binding RTX toxin-like protein